MFPKIFSKSRPESMGTDASGANDQTGGGAIDPLEGGASQDQDGGSASSKEPTYLETLFPDDWGSRFECMGELVVERKAEPSEVVQVYQTLNEVLEADIFYVNPTVRGLSIVCGIKDLGSFIDSIPTMPRLASWALTHR